MEKDIFANVMKLVFKNGSIPASAARQILYDEIDNAPEGTITISKCKNTTELAQNIRTTFINRIKRQKKNYRLRIKSFPHDRMIMIQKKKVN